MRVTAKASFVTFQAPPVGGLPTGGSGTTGSMNDRPAPTPVRGSQQMKPKDWASLKPDRPCTQGAQWRSRFGTHVEAGVEYCCSCGGIVDDEDPLVRQWQESRRKPPPATAPLAEGIDSVRVEAVMNGESSYRVLVIFIREGRDSLTILEPGAPEDSFHSAFRISEKARFDDLLAVLASGAKAFVTWTTDDAARVVSVRVHADWTPGQAVPAERGGGSSFGIGVGVAFPLEG